VSYGLDPNRVEPIGRQPARRFCTPSKPNPWYGDIVGGTKVLHAEVGGERFTAQQAAALRERANDPLTIATITVKRQATLREANEACWRVGELRPVFAFECPVIGRGRGGKLMVIAPAGDIKWIEGDGWAEPPSWRPNMGGYC